MPTTPALPNIPPDILYDFRKTFAPDYTPASGIKRQNSESWKTLKKKPLFDGDILRHLVGPDAYATSRKDAYGGDRPTTTTICIDLDLHKGAAEPLDIRTDKTYRAFYPQEPLAVVSTPSGGRHIYYLLHQGTRRSDAIADAERRLTAQGLEIKDGTCEILENKTLRRLPLQAGCHLLDAYTLDPISQSNIDGLYALVERLRDEDRPRLYIPPQRAVAPTPRAASGSTAQEIILSDTEQNHILLHGLQSAGTRRATQGFLVRHYYEQGLRGEQLQGAVVSWMESHHNGASQDWLRNKDRCVNDIAWCVSIWNGYTKTPRAIPDPAPWEMWIRKLKLPRPAQRAVLRGMCERAYLYGEVSECGEWIDVDIPKQSLRDFHRQYSVALPALYKWGHVHVIRGYEKPTDKGKGKCRRYRLPIASQNK